MTDLNRPDPRRPGSWCREGVAHDHGACGSLWDSADYRDVLRAASHAERLGERERRAVELPIDSIVGSAHAAWYKDYAGGPWVCTHSTQYHSNDEIDAMLQAGQATVLRVGTGA
jgi:hypothetical protein